MYNVEYICDKCSIISKREGITSHPNMLGLGVLPKGWVLKTIEPSMDLIKLLCPKCLILYDELVEEINKKMSDARGEMDHFFK